MKQVRATKQKQIIITALQSADHPTASELYEFLHPTYPTISRATVFRVLSQFAESGEIRKISINNNDARYDATIKPHAHFLCADCGMVSDIFAEEITVILNATVLKNYKIYAAELNYVGKCPNCSTHIN